MDSQPPADYPNLTADISVDVAVVGAGIAGLSTAWELVKAGRSVAVLEAGRVCAGVTGYTTAKLTSLHGLVYADLAESHGVEAATWYARSQQEAIEHVAATSVELGIECDFERRSAYTYVTAPETVPDIEREVRAANLAGLAASLVTQTDLPFPVAAAVKLDDQAQFHPRRYLLGLAGAIVDNGGAIYERCRVTTVDEGEPCTVATGTGHTVTAVDVVVATHYPILDRALLFTRLVPRRELVLAAPIPATADPSGMYLTREDRVRSVRTAPYGDGQRLLIVTGETYPPGAGDVTDRYERLARWTREHFPVEEFTHRWSAQDNKTSDGLPFVGPLHRGARHVWVATGYDGWGMTNGVMSGRLLAAGITGSSVPWTGLYDPSRLDLVREAGPVLKAQAHVARHFVGDRFESSDVSTPDELAPGAGAVMRLDGQRCAVYRDPDGTLHTVSATCTHLGCLVAFNDADPSWECPCHGSRFGVDGAVLQGPATKPLGQVQPAPTRSA